MKAMMQARKRRERLLKGGGKCWLKKLYGNKRKFSEEVKMVIKGENRV